MLGKKNVKSCYIISIVVAMKLIGRLALVIFLIAAVDGVTFAQQDPVFSQYMFNNVYNNPAYSGVEGVSKMALFYRSQWTGYTGSFDEGGAPQSTLFSFNAPILRFRSGAGFYVMDDRLGPQNNLNIMTSYAYHLVIGPAKLSFGIKAGIYSQTIDGDLYRAIHPNDPKIVNGKESQFRPDVGVGVFYQAEKYYGGVSLNHVVKSEFDFGSDELRNPLVNHLVVTGGYNYPLNYDIVLTPSFLFITDFNSLTFDISVLGTYKEKFWGGLSYRQSEAVSALLGYSFLKDNALSLGYSFDYVLIAQQAKQATSSEIQLSYKLPVVTGGGKPIQRTPRFRH